MSHKLDKLTVLRMAVQHLKVRLGKSFTYSDLTSNGTRPMPFGSHKSTLLYGDRI